MMVSDQPSDGFGKLGHMITPQTPAAAKGGNATPHLVSKIMLAYAKISCASAGSSQKVGLKLENIKLEALAIEVAKSTTALQVVEAGPPSKRCKKS